MEALYIQTNKFIQETQTDFGQLERKSNSTNIDQIEADILKKIAVINANCKRLDVHIYKLPVEQRCSAKLRCDQLKYDSRHLEAGFSAYQQRKIRRQQAASEREQLLSRRYDTASISPTNNGGSTAINMDLGVEHQQSLLGANRGVDELLDTGRHALDSLRFQRDTLKGAQKRILDMANALGLSNQTMRLIEKRATQDKGILIGGVVITLIVIVLVIYYLV